MGADAGALDAASTETAALGWMAWLAMAWAAGVATLALRLGYGVARVWLLEGAAREITDDGWLHLADGLARRLRLGRMVTLLRAGDAHVPMTWGVLRPVVLLPDTADGWDDGRRTVVLAHELAHVRRWDALTQWVAHVAIALFWFNPLVWMAARRMREEREHACDDAVLAIGARPSDYADHLLSLVRSLGRAEGPVAALAMARRSQFEGRLLAILDHATPRGGLPRGLGIAAMVGVLALVAPLAALRGGIPTSPVAPETTVAGGADPAVEIVSPDASGREGVEITSSGVTVVGGAAAGHEAAMEHGALPTVPPGVTAAQTPVDGTLAAIVKALPDDGKRATVLVDQVEAGQTRQTDYAAIIRAAQGIASADDRRRVLCSVLEQPDATAADGALALDATHTMGSDANRRIVIAQAVERGWITDPVFRAAFVRAAGHVESPGERRIVLWSVLEGPRLDEGTLAAIINLVPAMRTSANEQRLVLTAAAEHQPVTGRALDAYMAAVAAITSDTERSLALTALAESGASRAAGRTGQPARATGSPARGTSQSPVASRTSTWNGTTETSFQRDGRTYHVRIRAKDVVGGWDGTPVRQIRPGGSLFVQERCDTWNRVVRMRPRADGTLEIEFTENGEARPWNADAEHWMLDAIHDGTRQV